MAKMVRTWSDKYDLVDKNFDAGGNGNASRVKSKDNEEVLVLKELRNLDPEKKGRLHRSYRRLNTKAVLHQPPFCTARFSGI